MSTLLVFQNKKVGHELKYKLPIFNQLLTFIDKGETRKIAKQHGSERYIKKFTSNNHLAVLLFVVFKGYHNIRNAKHYYFRRIAVGSNIGKPYSTG